MAPAPISCSWKAAVRFLGQRAVMRRFTFTSEDLDSIRHERYHHPHPRVQQKMEVLWLKSQGFTHEEIARVADVSRRSVQRYLDEFLDGGLERVRCLPWKGKANELAAHQGALEDYFIEHPPRSSREARQPSRSR